MSTLVSTEAFTLTYNVGDDGIARLVMIGELDLAVADQVSASLTQRLADGVRERLDLSRLEFIDSTGLRALITVVTAGRAGRGEIDLASFACTDTPRWAAWWGAGSTIAPAACGAMSAKANSSESS